MTTHDTEIRELIVKVSEFVGAAKGTNRILATLVAISTVGQFVLQYLLRSK